MTRNRDIAQILGLTEAENTTNASLGDGSGGGSGVTAYSYDSSGGLLLASTTDHTDGSLHWLGEVNELYVWDSDASKYYLLENTKTLALGEIPPTQAQGSTYGFSSQGTSSGVSNMIQRFSFANDTANAADYGDLTVARRNGGSSSSSTHGYSVAGIIYPAGSNVIDKFSMASASNATDVGDMITPGVSADGSPSPSHGYNRVSFKWPTTFPSGSITFNSTVERYAYASDENASSVGSISGSSTSNKHNSTYTSSTDSYINQDGVDLVYKFQMSSSISTSEITNLFGSTSNTNSINSSSAGYLSLNSPSTPACKVVKVPFATDAGSTTTTSTNTGGTSGGSVSGETSGYFLGTENSTPAGNDYIDKYTFASDTYSANISTLLGSEGNESVGHQI